MLGLVALAGVSAAAAGTLWFLDSRGITPRALSPYVAKRSSGHNDAIEQTGRWMQRTLMALDRGSPYAGDDTLLTLRAGGLAPVAPVQALRAVAVADTAALRAAMAAALPGDVITLAPGDYAVPRGELAARRPGAEGSPIVVRAEQAGTVTIAMGIAEGFKVTAPYWTFENLTIRGVCKFQLFCEHAFHVVGDAGHFTARNNTVVDFNSHFKINARRGKFPDHGAIIGNTITNTTIRDTSTSVTLIDLVSGSDWTIRGNVITDFIKGGSDRISYGVFAKGAGARNILEQNIVICEHLLRGPGQRVGMSLGGGSTGKQYCRDARCLTEQEDSVIRANLIASCSDDGIYLNSAARSVVSHNTVLDTGGIVVRFATSSADVEGNLVDGAIRSRDGGVVRANDNLDTSIPSLYAGRHPVREMFSGVSVAALAWDGAAPRRKQAPSQPAPDLCGVQRPALPTYGAFESLAACKR
ncbi:right-handed parallel beta-helix repeat-containing protein [Massilia soli]|uniref:right-handed parallel beta-helix repeat-containing protein n=1 Tax=Massilia soli TaxID=2792854 RepID=UPI001CBCCACB